MIYKVVASLKEKNWYEEKKKQQIKSKQQQKREVLIMFAHLLLRE